MIHDRIGVGLIAFNRPGYFRRLLASLERQAEPENVDYHLFLDGAVNRFSGRQVADQRDVDKTRAAFKRADLLNKQEHIQRQNVGVGINQFEAVEWMADHYDHIALVEDDVVLTPYWLRLIRVLFGEMAERPDVFGFNVGFIRCCRKTDSESLLDDMIYGKPHWWAECFTADNWRRIRPHFMEYYALIDGLDYGTRRADEIWALYKEKGWPHTATSQDGGKDMSVFAAGMTRAVCVVNRGLYIGRHGVHFTSEEYERDGYLYQTPYVFEADAIREAFNWPEI